MMIKRRKTAFIFAIPLLLLTAAFIGDLSVEGWVWSGLDFLIAGILLYGTAGFMHLMISSKGTFKTKLIISVIIVFILMLVWMELAVGLFATPFEGS